MKSMYQPDEDSYLMSEVLENQLPKLLKINPGLTFLEIGSGSGIQLKIALEMGVKLENILSCDLNYTSVKHCKRLGFNCVKSDLFSNINESFDLIIFNPPYLPRDETEPFESRLSTVGGDLGSEIINEFLVQTKDYLNSNGKIILLTSSLTKGINWKGWDKKLLDKRKLFFEELYIYFVTLK